MQCNRRKFIKLTASGFAVTALSGGVFSCTATAKSVAGRHLNSFAIQLYSLRDVIGKDPKGVLAKVADMGYKELESFEGPQGMFWGMKNTEFAKFVEGLGMRIVSSHCGFRDFERKAAEAGEIGMKYLIIPSVGPRKTIGEFKKIAEKFNTTGQICKKNGIGFGYHNHAYSFKPVEGQLPQDVMMQNTDPDLVDFEMDIYWVEVAGEDPVKWFEKYPNRFKLCHIKDRTKNAPDDGENHSCILGHGDIDFKKILSTGKDKGLKYYIYEQERYAEAPPLEAARLSADYLKQFRF